MTRAWARALALVNWKGVFYERYLLDRHVTALEGANGAGKTTVMIAAYVVLLPDMSRLRFTNLGESGATGGDRGIWGRLGEAGRPSYAALDIEVASGRLIAGVELQRKAEPSVEPRPFVVTKLPADARLQDLLLTSSDGHDQVPDAAELKQNARKLGASIEIFASTKDYLAFLFEQGVTPLRLTSDEERGKYNDMLRTSMTGGISRALTSELRSFLLKEESSLGDTVVQMRANLDACRRTRVEVAEAQRLEHEIAGIFEAGQRMFGAAREATRLCAAELEREAEDARQRLRAEQQQRLELERSLPTLEQRHAECAERLRSARAALEATGAERARLLRARELGERLQQQLALLADKETQRDGARQVREQAAARRQLAVTERDEARRAYGRAAHGLGDVQRGLEELHRNAHAYRRAKELESQARELSGDPGFVAGAAAEALIEARRRKAALDAERVRQSRDTELLTARRADYEAALLALQELQPGAGDDDAHARARAALASASELESRAARAESVAREVTDARALSAQQQQARSQAAAVARGAERELTSAWVRAELENAERELADAEQRARELVAGVERAERELALAGGELERSQRAARESEALSALLSRLAGREQSTPWTFAQALELQRGFFDERERLRQRRVELEAARAQALRRAAELESASGNAPQEILDWRDELDAELLAARFDELEPDEAALMQARLGEVSQALVVADPERAAAELAGRERQLTSVWFVGPDFRPPELLGGDLSRDVLVRDAGGVRLTRLPPRSSLGRKARLRRAGELKSEAEAFATELDAAELRERRLDALLAELQSVLVGSWPAAAEPLAVAEDCTRRVEVARGLVEQAAIERAALSGRLPELSRRVGELRGLLATAYLLDQGDQAARVERLSRELENAESAARELERTSAARATLVGLLDALRVRPPSAAELESEQDTRAKADAERDRCFSLCEILAELALRKADLGWQSAEQALHSDSSLLPALEQQHAEARSALEAAEARLETELQAWEEAVSALQKLDGEWAALEAFRAQNAAELERERVADRSDAAFAELETRTHWAGLELERLEREERALATELALVGERRERLELAVSAATRAQADAERRSQPASEALRALELSLQEQQLAPARAAAPEFSSHRAAWSEAASKRELLLERVSAARHGAELLAALRTALDGAEPESASPQLAAWLEVRAWLTKRIPAQIAQGDDPLQGLERLHDHLTSLERRLERQEGDLRGASQDISRGIEVQLRRARNQIRRLGQSLEGVRFGSVQAIRVMMSRNERMEQVLRALDEGAAQEFLFQRGLPIEEALNEVFRRYGGGRSGGQRILDYREYVELRVEVQRRGSEDWEPANATRLSTGEAIGVGAALMMVVLTEWERDANLLRGRKDQGSLRFLFLDEANRLSHDNLGTLFDLCQTLDLQLLIAAPEVARAEGNTTYRLVRTVDESGHEEVVVSGRRAVAVEAPPEVTPLPVQQVFPEC
jgi:chromosome partition protein MukB